MTQNFIQFDRWIRTGFVEMNTALEEIYFGQEDRTVIGDAGAQIREQIVEEGRSHVTRLLDEGNTDEGFELAFDLLGNVGMYMAACRRHEISNPQRERRSPLQEASALALHLGASLGLAPRFASSHLTTHNRSVDGLLICIQS